MVTLHFVYKDPQTHRSSPACAPLQEYHPLNLIIAMAKSTIACLFALLAVAVALPFPQGFYGGYGQGAYGQNPYGGYGGYNNYGGHNNYGGYPGLGIGIPAQASAGGITGSNSGLFGNTGFGAGFGQASGPNAAFATGQASSSGGLYGTTNNAGGTAFGL